MFKMYLIKKNKFKLKINNSNNVLNNLFFIYKKRLLMLFKNNIVNNLKKYYGKKKISKNQMFIFLKLKYLITINKSNFKLLKVVKLFYNVKSKYISLKRKIYRIIKLIFKLRYLKLKKLFLIKNSLINIFFINLRFNYLYKITNGFFYNYMNYFDKSVAFIFLNKIIGF